MATKTNSGLVAYAKAQVGLPYWYGTYGQTASASLYKSKAKQYESTGYYTQWDDYDTQYNKRVHDCVGLIKGYLWSNTATSTPVYNKSQDKSAKTMYSAAVDEKCAHGKIATFPATTGLLVFQGTATSTIHHVGVYDGNGYVYEAKGHQYGVVKTAYKSSDWNYWAQCPYCEDDTAESTSTSTTTATASTASSSLSTTTDYNSLQSAEKFESGHGGGTKLTATGRVNLRYGASTKYSVITVIPKSGVVTWYGYFNLDGSTPWYKVKYGTKTGYVSSEYVE